MSELLASYLTRNEGVRNENSSASISILLSPRARRPTHISIRKTKRKVTTEPFCGWGLKQKRTQTELPTSANHIFEEVSGALEGSQVEKRDEEEKGNLLVACR